MPATRTALRTRVGLRAVVAGLTSSLLLAGCTGADDPPDPGPAPSPTVESPEPASLTFAAFGTDEQVAAYRAVAEAFERAEPEVDIEVEGYPDAESVVEAARSAAEDGSQVADVFLLDSDYLTALATPGGEEGEDAATGEPEVIAPLDDLLEERGVAFGDDHQRVALTELSAEASLQCMPAEMSPFVLYANDDLLPPRRQLRSLDVDLPRSVETWTWTEFVATARAIAAADLQDDVRGVYLPISLDLVTAFVRAAGDDVVDDVFEPTRIDLTSEEDLLALSQLAVLAADASVSPTPEEIAERSDVARFTDGTLGMMVGTRGDLPVLRASGVPFQVLPLPGFGRSRSVSSVTGYCIAAGSSQQELAADFITFAVSQTGAGILAESGAIVPARLDVASSEAFTQPGELPANYRVYVDAVRRSEPMPFAAEWPELSARTDLVLQRVLTDPTFDLGFALPQRMERLARQSERVLAPDETEETAPGDSGDAG